MGARRRQSPPPLRAPCGGVHIHLPRKLCFRAFTMPDPPSVVLAPRFADTDGHYLKKIWNPGEIFFEKSSGQNPPMGAHRRASPLGLAMRINVFLFLGFVLLRRYTAAPQSSFFFQQPHVFRYEPRPDTHIALNGSFGPSFTILEGRISPGSGACTAWPSCLRVLCTSLRVLRLCFCVCQSACVG